MNKTKPLLHVIKTVNDADKCQIIKIIDEGETQKKKKKQRQKRTRVTEAIVKGRERNDFVVRLSKVFSN